MPDGEPRAEEHIGTYHDGRIRLDVPVAWPEGTRVAVRVVAPPNEVRPQDHGPVIIAGFGLPGRCVADVLDHYGVAYSIVDTNPETIAAQRALGRTIIEGDIAEEETLRRAGIDRATILALTIPDEQAVLRATESARRLSPRVYIIARTMYSSVGMQAARLGADVVVKAEQAVARQFHEIVLGRLGMGGRYLEATAATTT